MRRKFQQIHAVCCSSTDDNFLHSGRFKTSVFTFVTDSSSDMCGDKMFLNELCKLVCHSHHKSTCFLE